MHMLQGLAFFVCAATDIALRGGESMKKFRFVSPAMFVFSGVAAILYAIFAIGAFDIDVFKAALDSRRGFLILFGISFILISAGISQAMHVFREREKSIWLILFFIFLFAIALLYAFYHKRVGAYSAYFALVNHWAAAGTLFIALVFKILSMKIHREIFRGLWAVFLMMTAFQLIAYRESGDAFGEKAVVLEIMDGMEIQISRDLPEPPESPLKHAKTPDKKRSRH